MSNISDLRLNNNISNANKSQNSNDKIGDEFAKMLKNEVEGLDKTQKTAEAAMTDITTGQVEDLHQVAITITRAGNSAKFVLEVRSKAISVYKEITRAQI